jgi:hypothetical protein
MYHQSTTLAVYAGAMAGSHQLFLVAVNVYIWAQSI